MIAVNKITIIGLIQALVIFIGFYGLGLVMKIQGYPNMETIQLYARPSSIWLRQHGLILLLIPILWTLSSVVHAAKNRQEGAINIGLVIGILFALALGFAFLYASWDTLALYG